MVTAGSSVEEVMTQIREEVTNGLGDWTLKSPVELELSGTFHKEGGGKARFYVLEAGAVARSEETQRIKICFGPMSPKEYAENALAGRITQQTNRSR